MTTVEELVKERNDQVTALKGQDFCDYVVCVMKQLKEDVDDALANPEMLPSVYRTLVDRAPYYAKIVEEFDKRGYD